MPRQTYFNSPLLLGFDQIERILDRAAKNPQDGYPPYNIEQAGSNHLRITLAVAGFAREDLNVTVEDNQLVIRGKHVDEDDRTYLHRGIASRQFQRSFVLADGIEVTAADLANGLLSIDLARPEPTVEVKSIKISMGEKEAGDKEIDLKAEEAAE